jgi:hypothetical protein
MVKDVGAGVVREFITAVWGSSGTLDRVVVSASVRRSLLARCRAHFSAEAAGMVGVVEDRWKRLENGF